MSITFDPIGLSLVELERVEANRLYIPRLDILDQTPLLDIKPFIPEFESWQQIRLGWVEQARGKVRAQRSDERFS